MGRMMSGARPYCTGGGDQRIVHLKRIAGSASTGREADQVCAIVAPCEVIAPCLLSRIKQRTMIMFSAIPSLTLWHRSPVSPKV